MINLSLTKEEANLLIKLLDSLVRLTGFHLAESALFYFKKIEVAYQELKEKEHNNTCSNP